MTYPDHPKRLLSTPLNRLRCLYESVSLVGGVPATFLPDERLADSLARCKALVVIEAECLPEATAERLSSFVEGGGVLIVVGPCGRLNEYGFASSDRQRARMRRLQGAQTTPAVPSFVTIEGRATLAPTSDPRIESIAFADLEKGVRLLGTYADGKPAVIENAVGEGRVLSVGCPIGVGSDARPGASMEFLRSYLAERGIHPSARAVSFFESSRNDLAILGLKDAARNDWLILANAGHYPLEPVLEWTACPPQEQLIDVLTGRLLSCRPSESDHPVFTIRLPAHGVALIGPLRKRYTVMNSP